MYDLYTNIHVVCLQYIYIYIKAAMDSIYMYIYIGELRNTSGRKQEVHRQFGMVLFVTYTLEVQGAP